MSVVGLGLFCAFLILDCVVLCCLCRFCALFILSVLSVVDCSGSVCYSLSLCRALLIVVVSVRYSFWSVLFVVDWVGSVRY